MPFLIFRRTNAQEFSLNSARLVAIVDGKKEKEVSEAIAEGAVEGEGTYAAIWFDAEEMVTKDVRSTVEVIDQVESLTSAEAKSTEES